MPTTKVDPDAATQDFPASTGLRDRAGSPRKAWGLTSLLVALYVINYADKAVLGIIAQPLADELGLRSSQIGLVGSLFFLTFTIGGFFAGALNRWFSLRWALVLLALCWAFAMLPLVAVAAFAVLIVSRLLLGFAEGPSSALLHTAAYSWHPPAKRALPGALLAGAASIAKIAIAPILALVTVNLGWRAALVTLSVAGLLWCVVWLATWQDGPYISGAKGSATSPTTTAGEEPAVPWVRIFTSRTFIGGALLVMSVYALVTVVLTWLPSYFEVGLGYSRLQAGSMFAFPSIVGLVLMLVTSVVADRLISRGATSRKVRVIVPSVGVLISGVLLFLLPSIGTPAVAVLVVSVGYGFATTVFPLMNAAISEICPPRQTAGTLGVFLAIMAIGGLVAPYATGLIVDAAATPAQGYATAFQILGLVASVCAVIALVLADPERDKMLVRRGLVDDATRP
ncbi:MFS transporter [Gordonia hankookensis]|uniref:MFS transporter n=1 Tax=Gordonia hankookensis TaxID=589403 RepID=A0ABR7WFF7_9ACTN|nr:MFS transporter [Gordonia hankookensis]MBD1321515.1 MFS transporter [Gordonia hankookensis]NDZ96195.1 MFS transporter [Streptomyces sp. SID11726]NEB23592.1 MFS transporter [Streptomyces sp. SID6673]